MKIITTLTLAASFIAMSLAFSPAEAKSHKVQVKKQTSEFSARRHTRRVAHRTTRRVVTDANGNRAYRVARRGGACDGFQRCRCGTTAARNFGISYAHNGWNLKMASEWRRFPRTSFHVGAAGVQSHHVLKVVGGSSCANATVTDDAGTYQRNVCNMTFHSVGGGGGGEVTQVASSPRRSRTHTMSARSHQVTYASVDRPQFAYGNLSVH